MLISWKLCLGLGAFVQSLNRISRCKLLQPSSDHLIINKWTMKPILTRYRIILTNSDPGDIMCQFLVSFTILIIILDEQQGNGQVILCISWPRPIIKYGQWLGLTRQAWVLQESRWAKYNDRLAWCITWGIEIMSKICDRGHPRPHSFPSLGAGSRKGCSSICEYQSWVRQVCSDRRGTPTSLGTS